VTSAPDEPTAAQLLRSKEALLRTVSAMLNGSGLEIRELSAGIAIRNPRDPDSGQIHIAYADWYVSWERTAWDYWGHLEGFDGDTGDRDALVSADKIISILASHKM
jgi:hypothetical protein